MKFRAITEGDDAKLLNSNLFEIAQLTAMPVSNVDLDVSLTNSTTTNDS